MSFIRPLDTYQREYDFANIAKEDLIVFLQKSRDLTYEQAKAFVEKTLSPQGAFPIKDPEVMYLRRKPNGDRVEETSTLLEYTNTLVKNELIIAPSLTVYIPTKVKRSIWADYIQMNLGLRKSDKAKMFEFKMQGDMVKSNYFKTLQESRKIKNNSLSGLQASPSTFGYNITAHSSLTSLCRCATSYANASNEKFIGGIRHYYAPTIVMNHMLTAIRCTDHALIRSVCEKYGLVLPTARDVVRCVEHSSRHYWRDQNSMRPIAEFAEKMSPEERAAFIYTGDLYHMDQHNSAFIKSFLKEMAYMDESPCADPKSVIKGLDGNYTAIASLLSARVIKGISLKDAETKRPHAYNTVASTALHMQATMEKYSDLIEAFFKPNYLPHSIAQFPTSKRMSVPTSDTDSTIFTAQYWADKYGNGAYTDETWGYVYVIVFLISGMIENTLLLYSANLGVDRELITELEMKNEFIFPVYVLTNLAKHYFAYVSAGEGNVYEEMEVERKGVNLRSSNAPEHINKGVGDFMVFIMDRILQGKLLEKDEVLRYVQNTEKAIRDNVLAGGFDYLNSLNIKAAESYSQGDEAVNYQSYLFWNDVFGSKYGPAPQPPYRAIKLTVNLPNKTAVNNWVASIEDPEIREKIAAWVQDNNKTSIGLFRLPRANVAANGIPAEIASVVDIRGIIREVMKPFYLILESLGLYVSNKPNTRILLDELDEEEIEQPDLEEA